MLKPNAMAERGVLDDTKTLDENRQGEVFPQEEQAACEASGEPRKLFLETYGCQMNFADSEIVASVMGEHGYVNTRQLDEADVVFLNTCAIRDNAEQKIRHRLAYFNSFKRQKPGLMVGILGCMAERLKKKLLEEEQVVDVVAGPDAYRDLPRLVAQAEDGDRGLNVFLSREETYADINPVRLGGNGVSAFISIMRGCDNMCSFCIVPFTRGRERSRDPHSIVREAQQLFAQGYREVTLLGQNVDSYRWADAEDQDGESVHFAELLRRVAAISPWLRVRFTTSHPKDITEEVVETMRDHPNICNFIHFPAQSGNSEVLKRMNRTYDLDWYLNRIAMIRRIVPDMGLSTDMIAGFCGETEAQHQDTLSLMEEVRYDHAYMFYYSERPGTLAHKKYEDDIPLETKKRRLQEIIAMQQAHSAESNRRDVGKTFEVLVEGTAKRSEAQLKGRNSQNKSIVFPRPEGVDPGDYVRVKIHDSSSATLFGEMVDVIRIEEVDVA